MTVPDPTAAADAIVARPIKGHDAQSGAASAALRAALEHARSEVRHALSAAVPIGALDVGPGSQAAAQLASVYDRALATRWRVATEGLQSGLALVATGGWARRELAPYSDIDFIVLHRNSPDDAKIAADRLLYPLWDAQVAVGHAVREPRAAARLARDDLATATALLDVRHISGDRGLTEELVTATRGVIAPGGNPNDFIAQLAAEKRRRHERFGDSLYLLEPNLKQGLGALRDLATALWAAAARWTVPRSGHDPLAPAALIEALVSLGHLTRRHAGVLQNARDFLLGLRAQVQLTARRRTDQLTFEIQEAIAPLRYPSAKKEPGDPRPAVAPAVEQLMRSVYLHTRGVMQVADGLLESARVPARRKPRIATIDPTFLSFNGEIAVKDPHVFAMRPSEMVRIFRVGLAEGLPIYGHTRELIAEQVIESGASLVSDPVATRAFVDALSDTRDAGQPSSLELMHQLGVMSALMPEWAPCTCRVQHDLYHVYTVDQHQLYAVAMMKRIARGELVEEHPLATQLIKDVAQPTALYLGTLLHDVGKPAGQGHAEKGAVMAGQVARRCGLSPSEVDLTEFLVRQHLTMSHLSQRRDLSDPQVVARFAEKVGDEQHLIALYLLSLCDAAMTAPANLTAWKEELLGELFTRTRARLRASTTATAAATRTPADTLANIAREKVAARLLADDEAPVDDASVKEILAALDPQWLAQLTPRQAARHVRLALSCGDVALPVGIRVSHFPMKGHSEVAVVAPDQPGVLAAIAGALTANRIDVLGAVVGRCEREHGSALALDLFYVRDPVGAAIAVEDSRWSRLESDLRALVATGQPNPDAVRSLIAKRRPPSGLPPRITPGVSTDIRVLTDDSPDATIVEVFTRDRIGVLHAITQTLADLGLDISLSKISTEGEKVADIFYVRGNVDGKRAKIVDRAVVDAITDSLHRALAAL